MGDTESLPCPEAPQGPAQFRSLMVQKCPYRSSWINKSLSRWKRGGHFPMTWSYRFHKFNLGSGIMLKKESSVWGWERPGIKGLRLRKVILDSGGLDFPAVSLSLIKYGFVLVLNLLNLNYEVREIIAPIQNLLFWLFFPIILQRDYHSQVSQCLMIKARKSDSE